MALIADGLLIVAALTAAVYCMVLARRVQALTSLDRGLGAAIAQLSAQVDGMQEALAQAKRASGASLRDLKTLTARAEMAAGRLELLLAALHENGVERPVAGGERRRPRPAGAPQAPAGDGTSREAAPRDGAAPDAPPRPAAPARAAGDEDPLRRRLRDLLGADRLGGDAA
ncbi:MAG: hypothetical protein KatS3mg118_3467 [Paracoccaceae bacterium]|nr:MAG: hypothetical protein D6686_01720 [Alphaproteobacteria bacterium]GIX15508.1 MAG: hypothetical protein KatS3mg118_3467 [Paracoccaceae bacterium]